MQLAKLGSAPDIKLVAMLKTWILGILSTKLCDKLPTNRLLFIVIPVILLVSPLRFILYCPGCGYVQSMFTLPPVPIVVMLPPLPLSITMRAPALATRVILNAKFAVLASHLKS